MANPDIPNGFEPVRPINGAGPIVATLGYLNASQTVAVGDVVIDTSGKLNIGLSSSGSTWGVVAPQLGATALGENVYTTSSADDPLYYYPAGDYVFAGQCSGTYARTIVGPVDIEGATGVMEINENASTEDVVIILGPILGNWRGRTNLAVGANSMVEFKFVKCQQAGEAVDQTA